MLSVSNTHVPPTRKPAWIRVPAPGGERYNAIREALRSRGLHSVCEEARCPNLGECWNGGTATFMLMGDTCTRACSFCAVKTGNPRGVLDEAEPVKIAQAVAGIGLSYVVLTTVDRDDLDDGGASHFAATVNSIREHDPEILVEVLTGDFGGCRSSIATVLGSSPAVYAHNVETVRRLTPRVRDRRSSYERSLLVLEMAKSIRPEGWTKTSIMLGLGETDEEVTATLFELRDRKVDLLTIGQYLRPSIRHLPVVDYVEPQRFEDLAAQAKELGFRHVASGPLVRSSYRAGENFVASALSSERLEGTRR